MSSVRVLERILKLVQLSASSNENEARNASLQACKLILEHKIVLALPNQSSSGIPGTNVSSSVGGSTGSADPDPRDWVQWNAKGNGPRPTRSHGFAETLFGREAADRIRNAGRRVDKAAGEDGPQTITAPQDGTCRDCGEEYKRGDRVWYRRGKGAVHTMRCNPEVLR